MTAKKKSDAATNPTLAKVTLSEPIKREGGDIAELTLRKPNSGELRGLSLLSLAEFDVDTLFKLVPRIAQPTVTEAELNNMPVADLFALAGEINNRFLQPSSTQGSPSPTE